MDAVVRTSLLSSEVLRLARPSRVAAPPAAADGRDNGPLRHPHQESMAAPVKDAFQVSPVQENVVANAAVSQPQSEGPVAGDPAPPIRAAHHEGADSLRMLREEAQRQGHEEGLARAREEMERELNKRSARLDSLAVELVGARNAVLDVAEDDLLALAVSCVHRILGDTVVSVPAIQAIVQRALSQFRSTCRVNVGLHPADLALWRESGTSLPEREVLLVGDERVALGGCVVSSEDGSLDARLEAQLDRLHAILMAARRAATESKPGPQ